MSNPEVMSKQKDNKWSNYALRVIVNTASHPFEYAKVLIQVSALLLIVAASLLGAE